MTEQYSTIEVASDAYGGRAIALNRPEVRNAFDETMISELDDVLSRLEDDADARYVTIHGNGNSFCAGADLAWMRRAAEYDRERNQADARTFSLLLNRLNRLPCPTIAKIHGATFGGGVGLVACCDIAIAANSSIFSLSEVRLGLIPSIIAPYVAAAIGIRNARRYFLTAERFDAATAFAIGLVHVTRDDLQHVHDSIIGELRNGGPQAQREAKSVILDVLHNPIDETMIDETARRIAAVRATDEAREGVSAFFEKRAPKWKIQKDG